ncbi:MAG: Na+-translocating NADH-quinone reductase subunit C [Rhodospirillales bacterium]|nr:Na+-translocating NADH-quinone reductase subunit C [Rhodospirillales bacterium]
MPDQKRVNIWRAFLNRPNTDSAKTLGVAFLVALGCSVIVSLTAIYLKPLLDANRLRESAGSLVEIVDALGVPVPQVRLVERTSGEYLSRATSDKAALDPDQDLAGLKEVENTLTAYEVRDGARLTLVILPVRGAGYKSTLHGYLALKADLNTIAALTFYQQDETPGMGARIMEKKWQDLWRDKKTADATGAIQIRVVTGAASGIYEVDGISGATRTGNGVSNLVKFWLGTNGYGPYLARLKQQGDG